ncbi:hypothetical protein ACLOJK_037493 [Asimina triloba]
MTWDCFQHSLRTECELLDATLYEGLTQQAARKLLRGLVTRIGEFLRAWDEEHQLSASLLGLHGKQHGSHRHSRLGLMSNPLRGKLCLIEGRGIFCDEAFSLLCFKQCQSSRTVTGPQFHLDIGQESLHLSDAGLGRSTKLPNVVLSGSNGSFHI